MNDSKVRVIQYKGLGTVDGSSLMLKFEGNERLFSELQGSGELSLNKEHNMTLYLKVDSGTVEVEEDDYIVEIVDKFDRRYLLTSKGELIHD